MLSIIVPAYNRHDMLARALRSLTAQTSRDFEIVICDDGSTEPLRPVIRIFEDILPITYLRIDNSGGPARPRNRAIAAARGDWFAFLDSDDWWMPGKVRTVQRAIQRRPDCDVFYHRLRIAGEGRGRLAWWRRTIGGPLQEDPLTHLLTRGNCIPNSSVVLSRRAYERVGLIDEGRDIAAIEDFDYWLRLAESGARFHFIDRTLGYCWQGADGISADPLRYAAKVQIAFRRHMPALEARDERRAARAQLRYELAHLHLLGNQPREARRLLRDTHNLSGRTWRRLLKIAIATVSDQHWRTGVMPLQRRG